MAIHEVFVVHKKTDVVGKGSGVVEALKDAGISAMEAAFSPTEDLTDPNKYLIAHASDGLEERDVYGDTFEVAKRNKKGMGDYFVLQSTG